MIRKLVTTGAICAVAMFGAEAHAAKASKSETVGVGSGAVIGAAAGGPVGLIIGAAIGAKIGDNYHKKNEQVASLESSLGESEQRVAGLEGDVNALISEVDRLQHVARPELVSLMQAGIDMDLLFRTDESALTDETGKRLESLAATLAGMSDVHIRLDGFADERGAADYNLALSEKRVAYVRELFVAAGVSPARIRAAAHGEVVATDTNVDSLAFERRVSVKLFIDPATSVASN